MKVGILLITTLWRRAYSPTIVVESQVAALSNAGHSVTLLSLPNRCDIPFIEEHSHYHQIPTTDWNPDEGFGLKFRAAVRTLRAAYREALSELDVIICHDTHFTYAPLTHNLALRQAQAELSQLRFIHWYHSAPDHLKRDSQSVEQQTQTHPTQPTHPTHGY